MGQYSDVAIAIKHTAFAELSPPSQAMLRRDLCDETDEDDEGLLFVARGIKWYCTDDAIILLAKELRNIEDEDFTLVEANYDFPDGGENMGSWDSPWNVCLNVSVSISVDC